MKNKLHYIIIGAVFAFAIVAVVLGIYTMNQLSEVSEFSFEIREASEIAIAALDFNVENFHTQLEVWEYAYEPNEKRWNAFEAHNEELTELLGYLVKQVEEEAGEHKEPGEASALSLNAEVRLKRIVDDLATVRADWDNLFESVNEQRRLLELGYNDVNSEHYLEYVDAVEKSSVRLGINEALFDALEFNREVDEFVEDQKDLLWKLELEQKSIMQNFSILFFILIIVFILFNVGVAMAIPKIFSESKK